MRVKKNEDSDEDKEENNGDKKEDSNQNDKEENDEAEESGYQSNKTNRSGFDTGNDELNVEDDKKDDEVLDGEDDSNFNDDVKKDEKDVEEGNKEEEDVEDGKKEEEDVEESLSQPFVFGFQENTNTDNSNEKDTIVKSVGFKTKHPFVFGFQENTNTDNSNEQDITVNSVGVKTKHRLIGEDVPEPIDMDAESVEYEPEVELDIPDKVDNELDIPIESDEKENPNSPDMESEVNSYTQGKKSQTDQPQMVSDEKEPFVPFDVKTKWVGVHTIEDSDTIFFLYFKFVDNNSFEGVIIWPSKNEGTKTTFGGSMERDSQDRLVIGEKKFLKGNGDLITFNGSYDHQTNQILGSTAQGSQEGSFAISKID